MFQFQPSISESDAVKARIDSKNTDSPVEQPENTEVVELSQDEPVTEVVETEAQVNEEITEEAEESETEEVAQPQESDETEDLYVEYNGREINLKDIEEWEQGNLRQSDYTRKTQAHAEDVKAFEAKQEEFNAKQTEFNSKLAQLNAIIEEDTPSAETLAEWREYEPEKYIEHTEKMSNRKKLLAESKAELPTNRVDMAKVSADLFANHPEWMENGKQSQKFTDDTNLMTKYAETRGIGQEELATFEAKHYEIMLDAARYQSVSKSNAAIEKKVRRAPVSTKPRAVTKNSAISEIEALSKKIKSGKGNTDDIIKHRQLQRQLNK
jgi:hypothetical protein